MPACAGRREGTPVRKSTVEPRQAARQDLDEEQDQSASSRIPIAAMQAP